MLVICHCYMFLLAKSKWSPSSIELGSPKKNWIRKFLFQKILKKTIVVENTIIHQCENFQPQTLYILICEKKRNLARFQIFVIAHCSPIQICRFVFFTQNKIQEFSDWKFSQWWIIKLSMTIIFFRFFWNKTMLIFFLET